MNTISARVILPFPTNRVDTVTSTRAKLRQQGLLELALTAAFGGDTSLLLGGENILLLAAGQPRHRYGCCAYVVSADGRKALPVIGCRAWFQAPLPAQAHTHPVWDDLSAGLVEAVSRLGDAMFDLNGAIVAARSWLSRRHSEVSSHTGSALLMSRDSHVLCAAAPTSPPPQVANTRPLIIEPSMVRPLPLRHSLRLAA